MEKVIITVVGRDTVGIIARICTYLSNNHVNVEDISQTVVQGYFNMMMIVDTSRSTIAFGDMTSEMDKIGNELGMKIHCQREEIFDRMHRI
ncbi:MAG TPA: ACT domain-containing protein [Methanocorpusculum sp.]|nr:ACT domain-containing protein [Methanocorpusculum sp.]